MEIVHSDLRKYLQRNIFPSRTVLVFPPFNGFRRFLIHKLIEDNFSSSEVAAFSIGQDISRRIVVCYKGLIREYQNKGSPALPTKPGISMIEKERQSRQKLTPTAAVYRPPAARLAETRHTKEDAGRTPDSKQTRVRRPDQQMYVPRPKRASYGNEVPRSLSRSSSRTSLENDSFDKRNKHSQFKIEDSRPCESTDFDCNVQSRKEKKAARMSNNFINTNLKHDGLSSDIQSSGSGSNNIPQCNTDTTSELIRPIGNSTLNDLCQLNTDIKLDVITTEISSMKDSSSINTSSDHLITRENLSSANKTVSKPVNYSEIQVEFPVNNVEIVDNKTNENYFTTDSFDNFNEKSKIVAKSPSKSVISEDSSDSSESSNTKKSQPSKSKIEPMETISISSDSMDEQSSSSSSSSNNSRTCDSLSDSEAGRKYSRQENEKTTDTENSEKTENKNKYCEQKGNPEEQNVMTTRISPSVPVSEVLVISDSSSSLDNSDLLRERDKKEDEKIKKTLLSTNKNENSINKSKVNPEESDWESLYDDSGECLVPSLMEELTNSVGRVKVTSVDNDYRPYQSIEERTNDGECIIEIYDFSPELKTTDLFNVFAAYRNKNFQIKWVDDTHALGVFPSPLMADEVLACTLPFVKTRPLRLGIPESRIKAKNLVLPPLPSMERPKTCTALARRLVSGALGLRLPTSSQDREKEKQVLKEAREKRRLEAKQREAAWEGTLTSSSCI